MIIKELTKQLVEKQKLMPSGYWRVVLEIYKGANLVWTAIKSCFGRGFWINEKPWVNTDSWKNNV